MSAMARRHRSEQRRLLGLRRAVHYTLASRTAHVPARLPAVVITGTTPKVKA